MQFRKKNIVIAISLALSINSQAQFSAELNLSDLNGSNGFVINGVNPGDESGKSVSNAGDINGDGIEDVIIGASLHDPGVSDAGSSFVVFGSNTGFSDTINLSTINATNGVYITGSFIGGFLGRSVSDAGDVNADGFDDLIIGSSSASHVVFGSNTGFPFPLNTSSLNGTNGFTIRHEIAFQRLGISVSKAGDINGDGIDDLIVGADYADPNGNLYSGSSYVVFGNSTSLPHPFQLTTLNGTNGFVINGVNSYDYSGRSVSQAGDINGDGIDDLIIGAYRANSNSITNTGSSYVVFGSTTGITNPFELSTIDGTNGFVINGVNSYDQLGRSVSHAGDVNGDGIDDLIIGAVAADPNGNASGSSYVVFGSTSNLPHPLDLSDIDGTNGFVINGVTGFDFSGFSVSQAGDINGDSFDDVIIGAYGAGSRSGRSYVVFGSGSGFSHPLNLSTINGTNGFVINGVNSNDESGFSVSQAGDVNGDGIDDLIIGAPQADPNSNDQSGSSYVVFGREKPIFANDFE